MRGRTLILVSHHVQLCAPGAKYIVSLDNGRVQYSGDYDGFQSSGVLKTLVQSGATDPTDEKEEAAIEKVEQIIEEGEDSTLRESAGTSDASSTVTPTPAETEAKPEKKKAPRKLVEEEKRAVGRIGKDIWMSYITACGGYWYWIIFAASLGLAALSPVLENGWLRCVSRGIHGDQALITGSKGVVRIIPQHL